MEWISVEDRLPVNGTLVLVSLIDNVKLVLMGMCGWATGDWRWRVMTFDGIEVADYPVTHWMPLPDPPQDALEDGE